MYVAFSDLAWPFRTSHDPNETWRPLWGAKKDLDREKEIPQDRSGSVDGLRLGSSPVERWPDEESYLRRQIDLSNFT